MSMHITRIYFLLENWQTPIILTIVDDIRLFIGRWRHGNQCEMIQEGDSPRQHRFGTLRTRLEHIRIAQHPVQTNLGREKPMINYFITNLFLCKLFIGHIKHLQVLLRDVPIFILVNLGVAWFTILWFFGRYSILILLCFVFL